MTPKTKDTRMVTASIVIDKDKLAALKERAWQERKTFAELVREIIAKEEKEQGS